MKKYYGYIRVSTRDQHEDRQVSKLLEAGVSREHLFLDKQSGKNFERENYKRLLSVLDSESVLFVLSIDRLGRNYKEIIEQWKIITQEKGVKFGRPKISIPENLQSSTSCAKIKHYERNYSCRWIRNSSLSNY